LWEIFFFSFPPLNRYKDIAYTIVRSNREMNYYYNLPDDIIQKIQKINMFQELKNSHEIWWKLSAVKSQELKNKIDRENKEISYQDYFDMPRLFNLVFDIKNFKFDEAKIKQDFTIKQLQEKLIKNKFSGKLPKQYKTLIREFMKM